jgi:mannose-6-phosphate isomerase
MTTRAPDFLDPTDPAALRAWTADILLPFWASAGFEDATGLWVERVSLDGAPDDPGFRRLRVQARQTYVFALAEVLGLFPTERGMARRGRAAVDRLRTAEGGYLARIDSRGEPLDTRVLLYDQAFALLALSACHRTGDPTAEAEAVRLRAFLDAAMAHPAGGYATVLGDDVDTAPRAQDPHMHLFEACLAWHQAGGDDEWLAHADGLAALFGDRLVDRAGPHLAENFVADWSAPTDDPSGADGQPGHFCEWAWLIDWYGRSGGRHAGDLAPIGEALYRRAIADGLDRDATRPLALVNAITPDGEIRDPDKRFWPQTEAIKAANLAARHGDPAAGELARDLWRCLFTHYLSASNGVLRDNLSTDGARCAAFAPASSLYHLFVALLDTLDLFHQD